MAQFFEYHLPVDRIAQYPVGRVEDRSSARLLRVRFSTSSSYSEIGLENFRVSDLPLLLSKGDLLVLNNSKVIPCRFFVSVSGGEHETEVLLVRRISDPSSTAGVLFEALARPMRKLKAGDNFQLSVNLKAAVLGRTSAGDRLVLRVSTHDSQDSLESIQKLIELEGQMPIPGYIRRGRASIEDKSLYQTVFADVSGSIAAPTAGLHFTPKLLADLSRAGIDHCFLTHHVGVASFMPVREPETHQMPVEEFEIDINVQRKILDAMDSGHRIVAVGTTSVRALESWAIADYKIEPGKLQSTQLFITPGFNFKVVNLLMTNFHQPCTTHLLLVSAFAGSAVVARAYEHALLGEYRFLSYGDAMLLEPTQ